jgi:hypothetical protein
MHKMVIKILLWFFYVKSDKNPGEMEKLMAYKDVYLIPNFQDVLKNRLRHWGEVASLRIDDEKMLWFNRGRIAEDEKILLNMKKYHDLWVEMKK